MNIKTKTLAFLIIFFSFQLHSSAQETPIENKIDDLFEDWNHPDSPGASIVITKKGKTIFSKGYGSANLNYKIPNSPDTKFMIADLSKQFIAYALLNLVAEGKISLEDKIDKYLPELSNVGSKITIQNLATHSSGLLNHANLKDLAGFSSNEPANASQILQFLSLQKEPNIIPGSEFNYNNTDYVLITEIIERVTEKSFEVYVREHIFEPLEMNHSSFQTNPTDVLDNTAYIYYSENNIFKNLNPSVFLSDVPAMYSTTEDMTKWIHHLHSENGNSKQLSTEQFLNDGSRFGEDYGYAYAQFVDNLGGVKRIHHNGLAYGNLSYLCRFPEHDFSVLVVGNHESFNARSIATEVAEMYLSDYFTHTSEHTETPSNEITYISLPTKELQEFEGEYWSDEVFNTRRLYVRNDTLRYTRGMGDESSLAPIDNHSFRMLNIGMNTVQLDFDGDSLIVSVNNMIQYPYEKFEPSDYSERELKLFSGTFVNKDINVTYNLSVQDSKLIASHIQQTDIILTPSMDDTFQSPVWHFSQIKFDKNKEGFWLSTSEIQNIWFDKVS